MKNLSQRKGKVLFVSGLFLFPVGLILMHMKLDMASGIAFGVGIVAALIGLKKIKEN